MEWDSPLIEATLLKRYKRFLADILLNQELLTIHVPNTGAMTSCWGPNWKCMVSRSRNPSRKMPLTLELTWNGESWIGVNTGTANKVVKRALGEGAIPELTGYSDIVPEKKIGNSRVDFFLSGHSSRPNAYLEVKSVTLKKDGLAQFPDTVSERGQKHLRELMELKKQGHRALLLFLVQREDVESFQPAYEIDPDYAHLLSLALQSGVEVLVYQCRMTPEKISIKGSLPLILGSHESLLQHQ